MRVIAGSAGGLQLKTRKGDATRPTLDRVREALFSILGPRIIGASFVDLFAGTGAVGIEALSRGAKYVIFVETNQACVQLIKQNLEATRLGERAKVFKGPAVSALNRCIETGERVDFVFCDPPYGRGLIPRTIEWLEDHPSMLAAKATVITQQEMKEPAFNSGKNLRLTRQHRVGSARLDFYHCEESSCE